MFFRPRSSFALATKNRHWRASLWSAAAPASLLRADPELRLPLSLCWWGPWLRSWLQQGRLLDFEQAVSFFMLEIELVPIRRPEFPRGANRPTDHYLDQQSPIAVLHDRIAIREPRGLVVYLFDCRGQRCGNPSDRRSNLANLAPPWRGMSG